MFAHVNEAVDNWRFMGKSPPVEDSAYSQLDTVRWGLPTYRIYPKSKMELTQYEDSLVIARIDAKEIDLVNTAVRMGYVLCDTLCYWKGSSQGLPEPLATGYWMRPIEPKDAQNIAELARNCFEDYRGHYHNDPKMDNSQATEAYVQWASEAKTGVVIEHEIYEYPVVYRNIIAFGVFQPDCDLALAGVHSEHSGRGLYSDLVRACMQWGFRNGKNEISSSTQLENVAVQKVWARLGLSPTNYVYTLHRWP